MIYAIPLIWQVFLVCNLIGQFLTGLIIADWLGQIYNRSASWTLYVTSAVDYLLLPNIAFKYCFSLFQLSLVDILRVLITNVFNTEMFSARWRWYATFAHLHLKYNSQRLVRICSLHNIYSFPGIQKCIRFEPFLSYPYHLFQ